MDPTDTPPRTGPLGLRLPLSATGPVPVDTAWDRYQRLALWPTWSPQLRWVSVDLPDADIDDDPDLDTDLDALGDATWIDAADVDARLRTALTGRVHGPLGVRADFTVLTVDLPARRWSWLVRRGPLAVRLDHGVDEAPGGGSSTTLVLHGPAPVVLGYAPLAWYALHRLVTLQPDT